MQTNSFGTGVGQTAEATSHLLLAFAHNPQVQVQARMAADLTGTACIDRAVNESLRMYPLFGVAQRITSAGTQIGDTHVPADSVLCFNHLAYQESRFEDPTRFDPAR
ncbi:cytochrome P450 [Streptomyces spectabilis]|uniref:cytochrome P450 n=1 Tax=Streptomyces spectabilis TaxID=68270 RepID=UPI0034094810